ncbi:MAG: bifunctional 4-hydroxy-2-oxoglutarate aldolase/2-dehydro-3-deoxy-phosphogluconate aldolase [Spirochaetaceae bacterium]|jgi:2-dehydro-3-deoxyphosphogluconate aldolase/(4S)-4-hydroxy-2-oxoglutarate aldolase|nr:bifunctional 4-hydroxy-2-oxoglutarate aldolase/2-dehydro-3-deoxy-phosphogluconate aldolase [Spirochaetaceae bacterium]
MTEKERLEVRERIAKTYLVPVVVLDDAKRAVDTVKALAAGGVDIAEITLRTEAGLAAIEAARKGAPDVIVGAGTVVTSVQCRESIEAGAQFVVSPGLDKNIVECARVMGVPVFPGCVTPTEIMVAIDLGLKVVKFFPANVYGGIKAIKALAGPFPKIKFIPTGGVDLSNLADYIDDSIYAVGGGWLCDKKAVNSGDYAALTKAAADSVAVLRSHGR